MSKHDLDTTLRSAALFAARVTIAAVFAFHGAQKLFGLFDGPGLAGTAAYLAGLGVPLPDVHAVVVATVELAGALALVSGIGMRATALPLAFAMLVAALLGHDGFDVQRGGMEYPLVLAAVVPALAAVGPGEWSLGRVFAALRAGLTGRRSIA